LSVLFGISLIFTTASSLSQQPPAKSSKASDAPVAVIEAVTFEGAATLSEDVRAEITSALRGETRHPDWLKRFQARAQREFINTGYFDAAVTTRVNSSRQVNGVEHVTMLVTVNAGPRYHVKSINWKPTAPLPETELNSLSGIHVGDLFNMSKLGTTMAAVQGALRAHGFKESSIVPGFNLLRNEAQVELYLDVDSGMKDAAYQQPVCTKPSEAEVRESTLAPSAGYDPKRNGQLDLARAQLQAEQLGKRVLIFVGGEWCAPCVALERTITQSSRLTAILHDHFVPLYLNAGDGDECALRKLPDTRSYPMVYVFDAKGKLLAAHNPTDWLAFEGFDAQRIEAFLHDWQ